MKRMKSLLALGLALAMAAFCLTGCSGSSEEEAESEAVEETYIASQAGGSITWPEGLDTSATFASQLDEASGTLYVVFNSVQNRFTNYFTPAGDSITVTSYATSEKDTATTQYLVTLWEEAEGGRAYVNGHTIEFATGGDCATATFDGLTPGKNYKIGIAYMSGVYRINGGLSVSGLARAQALEADTNPEAAGTATDKKSPFPLERGFFVVRNCFAPVRAKGRNTGGWPGSSTGRPAGSPPAR